METFAEKHERTFIKLILGSAAALVLFILLCWGAFRAFRSWQEGHLVRRAAAVMSGGDLKAASLSARRVLQMNPENVDALRLMAEIAEKNGDRGALHLRQKVFEANQKSAEDALALVRTALRFNDIATAQATLEKLAQIGSDTAEFHAASGRLAEMKGDFSVAERHWARAAELAPNESGYRFQLAFTRLNSGNQEKRDEAIGVLEQLRTDPAQRAAATRALIIDGITRRADAQRLRALAQDLQSFPEAAFSDRLMYLEILRQLRDPAFDEYFAALRNDAASRSADLGALVSWMIRNGMQREALNFAAALPQETTGQWPLALLLAEARAQSKEWPQLEQSLRESNWGRFDYLRRAYLARALRGQEKQLAADQELAAAQKEAGADPQMVTLLTQTVAEWGWQSEAIELLWLLTKNPETRISALRTLYNHYTRTGDTAGLYRALAKLAEINPDDTALQNNLAQVSLLIGADVDRARKIAAEVAGKEPGNAAYASTHAYALLSKGDVKGALEVMSRLSPEQLRDASVATYYGLILAAAGETEKAREFLRRSSEAQLLPEEKALVAKAEKRLSETGRE